MALFGKVFSKKECSICGGEIGLLGNRKLEDGNCCKECARKLSPWFDERRHSTTEQIKAQLAYREQNERDLAGFTASVVEGQYAKMFIEMKNGVPYRFVVSNNDNFKAENADIILFSNVLSCNMDIRETRDEEKRLNENNERVSYNPPRYTYSYDFYIELAIANTPWFDDIRFKVNSYDVELISEGPTFNNRNTMFGRNNSFDPSYNPQYREYKMMCERICDYVARGQQGQAAQQGYQGQMAQQGYQGQTPAYGNMGAVVPNSAPAFGVPNTPAPNMMASAPVWSCPSCGSNNEGKFCENCGTKKPEVQPGGSWTCACGSVNTGKFCQNCGNKFGA